MKTVKHFLIILIIFVLFSCTKKEEVVEKPAVVAGKTYYNTVDEFGNENHSKVWFGKDGTFVLSDNFHDGTYEMNGSWIVKEDVCTLEVKETGVGQYNKVIFEIKDPDTIILKTTIAGSKAEATFSTTEVKGSSQPNNTTNNTDTNSTTKEVTSVSYFNCYNCFEASVLMDWY